MKKIGLIGGTGPESTLLYYKEINRLVNERTKGKEFPEITIESVDLIKAVGFCKDEDYDGIENYLLDKLNNLAKCNVDFVALTAATMHIVYDRVNVKSPVTLISIPEVVSDYAKDKGYKKIGLLGTIFTMKKDYLKIPFIRKEIEIVTPSEDDMVLVNKRISEELEYGIIKKSTEDELISIIEKMKKEQGIEAIILGCTELPLILNERNCPVDCLDIVEIHIRRLVDLITEE